MRVIIAPDKFKGSLTAAEVGHAVAEGLHDLLPDLQVDVVPVADGGDGTVAAALAAGYRAVRVPARGPTGRPGSGLLARRGDRAVVELAATAGLVALPDGVLDPLGATSAGAGDLLQAALDDGARHIVLGLGGSASTDGGAGLLQALGARLLADDGQPLNGPHGPLDAVGGGELLRITRVDLDGLDRRWTDATVVLASDVDNPLLGPLGAAAVYGPQKGADPDQVALLERALGHWAQLLDPSTRPSSRPSPTTGSASTPGSGAAGGVGFAALSVLGAVRRPGIDVVLELTGLPDRLAGGTLVITGEGHLDEQTLHGKAPAGVAAAARHAGVPVVAVCGQLSLTSSALSRAGIVAAYPLTDVEPDVTRCLAAPAALLRRTGHRIAAAHLGANPAR